VYRGKRGAKCDYELIKRYLPREKDSRIVQFSDVMTFFEEVKMVVSHRCSLLDLLYQHASIQLMWLTLHDCID
jgi:hypothetical protein